MNQNFDGSNLVTGSDRPNKLLVTFDEASAALSISLGMLRKLVRTGHVKVVHIGRSVRIPTDELLRVSAVGGVK
jgi:excisionase family DNA binding protein